MTDSLNNYAPHFLIIIYTPVSADVCENQIKNFHIMNIHPQNPPTNKSSLIYIKVNFVYSTYVRL